MTKKIGRRLPRSRQTWIVPLTIIMLIFASLGAYYLFHSKAATPVAGDINGDSKVDYLDLAILASNYHKTGQTRTQGNLDGDPNGNVDVYDFAILASNWGVVTLKSTIGINAYHTSDYPLIASLGIKDIRVDFPGGTQPNNPDPTIYAAAKNAGLTILPIFDYNYFSDTGGCSDGHCGVQPQYATQWAKNYMKTIVGALNMTGTAIPEAVEVYNEPWNPNFWRNPNPSDYLALIKATSAVVWGTPGWSNVKILVSADTINQTVGTGADWRTPLLAADSSGFLNDPRIHPTDHPYVSERDPNFEFSDQAYGSKWNFDRYKNVYADFKAHGHPSPTVWVTEYGWSTSLVSQTTQATYTTQAMDLMRSSGIVEKSYDWLLGSGTFYTQNGEDWLNASDNCKLVCANVKQYIIDNP